MRISTVRIRPTDFPTRRRRRRRDQNSTCCCLGMVVVCAIIALIAARGPVLSLLSRLFHSPKKAASTGPTFPLAVGLPRPDCYRYDLLPIEVAYVRPDGTAIADTAPEVVVRDSQKQILATVGDVEKVPLRYDSHRGLWCGGWPVPFGAPAGAEVGYTVEVRAQFDPTQWKWETPEEQRHRERTARHKGGPEPPPKPAGVATAVAWAPFQVLRAAAPTLPPGTCAVTWEPDFPDVDNLTGPDGKRGDWKIMFDWAKFMGADAVWFRGGVTEAYGKKAGLSHEHPFNNTNIGHLPEMAKEAHARGLKFGVWVSAFETYPNRPSEHERFKPYKPKYRWTQNYSRSRGVPVDRAAISLLDPNRPKELARFLADTQAIEGVDYLGMDYIRSGADWGGYELIEPFSREMPVQLPPEWASMSADAHMGWICGMLEGGRWQTNINLYHQWNWWRAHKVSEVLRDIIRQANLQKPLWTFSLSWWHGEQHGQDPLMFADAGVTIDAVMLYECDSVAQFDQLVEDWRKAIPANNTYIMGGDQVSFPTHQRLTRPAAPEEMYRRITTAASSLTQGGPLQGAFVHDVSRICVPNLRRNRGPYSGREWALAGAAAFSKLRGLWGVYPIDAELIAPKTASIGGTITCPLRLKNRTAVEVKNIALQILDTTDVNIVGQKRQTVASLKPQQQIEVPLQLQITSGDEARANRFMIAVQVTWPQAEYGKSVRADLPRLITAMAYLNAG